MTATAREMEPESVPLSELIGNQAVRALCGGVSRPTLIKWRGSQGFPAPVLRIDRTEIWDRREVAAWVAARKRNRRRKR